MNRDELVSRIFLRSALPLIRDLADDKPFYKKLFPMQGVIQFMVKDNEDVGAFIAFVDREISIIPGRHECPDLTIGFKTTADLNAFFAGKMVAPSIKGFMKIHLLLRILPLLLGVKILLPSVLPEEPEKRALKVRLVLYMITNALSQLNKADDEEFGKITKNSPDRIFQWTVKDGPAAYLRMKNGKTKAGRGTYTRRRPFVHMIFPDIDSAFMVLTAQAPLVEAVRLGYVVTEGAMEGSKDIGYQMQRIEELTGAYA
ncbi:hypothetical protein ACFL4G_08990 [Thermodesulfobacteriota bacterium]